MTVKESVQLFQKELSPQFSTLEITSMTTIIFSNLMNYQRVDVLLNAHTEITDAAESQIYNIITQLKRNKPLQYILGETEFYGLKFFVDESVLIPRPETEELVEWILRDAPKKNLRILDIGTGSGCIPIALKKNLPAAEVLAVDISEMALATAAKNARNNQVEVRFLNMDILMPQWADLGMFDIIVSNPPYVTPDQKRIMHQNVVDFEPHQALFVPENDPLVFYRAIARYAEKRLNPTGVLYFEINESFSEETASVVRALGFVAKTKQDINGKFRMLKASR